MHRLQLAGVRRGKVKRTTLPGKVSKRPQDLVERSFVATAPNRLCVSLEIVAALGAIDEQLPSEPESVGIRLRGPWSDEQQMLVIGRALMSKPPPLLHDEPSLGNTPCWRTGSSTLGERSISASDLMLVDQRPKQALALAAVRMCFRPGASSWPARALRWPNQKRSGRAYLGL